jgi:predicted metal-binding membrane protein
MKRVSKWLPGCLPAFVGMWALMMAAMMLPSVAPVASMYQRPVRSYRALRLAGFTGGYLLAWAGAGIPAFLLTAFVAQLVNDHPAWATAAAAAVFASCGVYQLTPLKSRCLKHCRSPLSLLLHCGAYRGRLRDVRAGAHHGAYCLGCCWSLMALFVVVGVMNLAAMVVLAGPFGSRRPAVTLRGYPLPRPRTVAKHGTGTFVR